MTAIPLMKATEYARASVAWLLPHCDRIEVAGSIRRRRSFCNDIDLVVIPKCVRSADLFGAITSEVNQLHQFLIQYVKETPGASWLNGENNPAGASWSLILKSGVQLDIWVATPKNFGIIWMIRTGSKEHNVWLCELANSKGFKIKTSIGVMCDDKLIASETEANVFNCLGLDWVVPEDRER